MKSILGILYFDPTVSAPATFTVLSPATIGDPQPIVWSHNPADAGRHIGTLNGAFTTGTTGRIGSFFINGTSMTIEGSSDTNDVIVQTWDKDGVEVEVYFNILIEIIVP